jgi:hypothetical protein
MTGESRLEIDFFNVLTGPADCHLRLKGAANGERNYLESYIFQRDVRAMLHTYPNMTSKPEIQMHVKLQCLTFIPFLKALLFMFALTFSSGQLSAQFIDHFNGTGTPKGWVLLTGDGGATIDFRQKDGIASLHVDARKDKLNIWWALARRRIPGPHMERLSQPEYELRIEARIRSSHAPRRVNLHANHQRTTDFHSHLMKFDIADTVNWHTISMTTRDSKHNQVIP